MTKLHLQKAFFGKDNCLKVTLNKDMECYFEFGTPKTANEEGWNWNLLNSQILNLVKLFLF